MLSTTSWRNFVLFCVYWTQCGEYYQDGKLWQPLSLWHKESISYFFLSTSITTTLINIFPPIFHISSHKVYAVKNNYCFIAAHNLWSAFQVNISSYPPNNASRVILFSLVQRKWDVVCLSTLPKVSQLGSGGKFRTPEINFNSTMTKILLQRLSEFFHAVHQLTKTQVA